MKTLTKTGPLILGASGQIGRMLNRLWADGALKFGGNPVWQVRGDSRIMGDVLIWDILNEPAPPIAPSGVICLAGGSQVTTNAAIARAALQIAGDAPLLYASSQTVYGVQDTVLTETSICQPIGGYGQDKLAAEMVLANSANATCLRIGNAIGADALLRSVLRGPVSLDQFPDGQGPRRMMIGPQTLGQAFSDLLQLGALKHRILNLAQPSLVSMADLLDAAEADWHWVPAPETAIPSLALDLSRITSLIQLPPADPAKLMAEVRAAGWGAMP